MSIQKLESESSVFSRESAINRSSNPGVTVSGQNSIAEVEDANLTVTSMSRCEEEIDNDNDGVQSPELDEPIGGGLEWAILVLITYRLELFGETIESKFTESSVIVDRIKERANSRVEEIENSLKQLSKAGKAGGASEALGWLGTGIAFFSAGVMIATGGGAAAGVALVSLAVTLTMQVDGMTGGHLATGIAGDDPNAQMALMVTVALVLMVATSGTSGGLGALGNRGSNLLGKGGKIFGSGSKAGGAGASSAGLSGAASGGATAASSGSTAAGNAGSVAAKTASRGVATPAAASLGDDAAAVTDEAAAAGAGLKGGAGGAAEGASLGVRNTGVSMDDRFKKFVVENASKVVTFSEMMEAATVAGQTIFDVKASYFELSASKLRAAAMELQADEKRLESYQRYINQSIQDLISQYEETNRSLIQLVDLAFAPRREIANSI